MGTHCSESWVIEQDGASQGCESLKQQGCAADSECLQGQDHRCIKEPNLNSEKTWEWGEIKLKMPVIEKVVSSLTALYEW